MSPELEYFRNQELEHRFQHYSISLHGRRGLALNPASNGGMTFYALEKTGNVFFVIAKSTRPDFPTDLPLQFRMDDDVGEVFSEHLHYSVRFDFSARHGMLVHHHMWQNHRDANAAAACETPLPRTTDEVRKKFFTERKGLFRRPTWSSFTVHDPDDDWNGVDHEHSNASFLVLAADCRHTIHACRRGSQPLLVSSFTLSRDMGYPLRFKVSFSGDQGAVSVNDETLVGIFDFKALKGEVIAAHQWEHEDV